MEKPLFVLLAVTAGAVFISSCKKEPAPTVKTPLNPRLNSSLLTTAKENSKGAYNVLTDVPYPVNYLQQGNFWIYECTMGGQDYDNGYGPWETHYTDSVVVDSFIIDEYTGKWMRLSHYQSNSAIVYNEYLKIDIDGGLLDYTGHVRYYFYALPDVSDLNVDRKGGCGGWQWNFHWADTSLTYKVGAYNFPAGLYTASSSSMYCGGTGLTNYYLVKGVGTIAYEQSTETFEERRYNSYELKRFKLKH
jgi:hypothetical protein